MSKTPCQHCKFCQIALIDDSFSPQSTPYCPWAKAFWYQVFSYILKPAWTWLPSWDHGYHGQYNWSLGLHKMNANFRCPDTTVNVIHNIMGLGIQVLTTYLSSQLNPRVRVWVEWTITRSAGRIDFKKIISKFNFNEGSIQFFVMAD